MEERGGGKGGEERMGSGGLGYVSDEKNWHASPEGKGKGGREGGKGKGGRG